MELLIDTKGYTDLELPSNETIRNIINAEGYAWNGDLLDTIEAALDLA